MPIILKQFGKHQVQWVEFGLGDILTMVGKETRDGPESILMFSQDTPHQIGGESTEYLGQSPDVLPDVKIVMQFNSPESITSLINQLTYILKSITQHQITG